MAASAVSRSWAADGLRKDDDGALAAVDLAGSDAEVVRASAGSRCAAAARAGGSVAGIVDGRELAAACGAADNGAGIPCSGFGGAPSAGRGSGVTAEGTGAGRATAPVGSAAGGAGGAAGEVAETPTPPAAAAALAVAACASLMAAAAVRLDNTFWGRLIPRREARDANCVTSCAAFCCDDGGC